MPRTSALALSTAGLPGGVYGPVVVLSRAGLVIGVSALVVVLSRAGLVIGVSGLVVVVGSSSSPHAPSPKASVSNAAAETVLPDFMIMLPDPSPWRVTPASMIVSPGVHNPER